MPSSFRFNEGALQKYLDEQVKPKLQAQANEQLKDILLRVQAEYNGEPVEDVESKIIELVRTEIAPKFTPGSSIRAYAQAIVDGNLTE